MNLADLFIAKKLAGGGGGGTGTDNYNDLSNKPQINSTSLTGDKSAADLGLQSEINGDNKISADYVDDSTATNKFVTSSEKLTWGGKQDKIDADHKLSSDLVDDTNKTNKFVTSTEKSTWNGKQNAIDSSHKLSSDLVDDTNHTNKFVTSSEKETWNGKQDALTFDNTPTSGSNNPVKSGGIYTELAGKVNTSDIIPSSQGIPASPTDITVPSMKLVADTYVPNSSLVEVVDNGAKNLVPVLFPNLTYQTVKITNNGDGSITLNGTRTGTTDGIAIQSIPSDTYTENYLTSRFTLPEGEYTILATGNTNLRLQVYAHDGVSSVGLGASTGSESVNINYNNSATYPYIAVRLWVAGSASFSNVKFTPMICTKSQFGISPEYEPHALGNQYLTPALIQQVDEGAKNKLNNTLASGTVSQTVTATVSSDKTVTCSGTAPSGTDATFITSTNTPFSSGTYVLSGCPSGGATDKYRIDVVINDTTVYRDEGSTVTFTLSATSNVRTQIVVYRGTSAPSASFKPMICTLADWNASKKYVPYRPNWDLVGKDVMLSNQAIGGNLTSFDFDISEYKGTSSNRYRYGLLVGGVDANNVCLYHVFIDASNNVTLTPAIPIATRTLTAAISGTTLTITTDSTMYGGLRLIWLD